LNLSGKKTEINFGIQIAKGENIYQSNGDINIYNMTFPLVSDPIEFVFTRDNDTAIESYFQGRDLELNDILTKIENNTGKILLTGIGGIGKTHLGRYIFKYFLDQHNSGSKCNIEYLGYLTYSGNFDQTIVRGIRYEQSDNYDTNLKKAWDILEQISQKKTLIIIDNVDKYFQEDVSLNKLNALNCNVIMTSRFKTFSKFESFIVKPLSLEYCRNIFLSVYPEMNNSENMDVLNEILEKRAARHTFTVELLAKIARSNDWDIIDLANELSKDNFNLHYNENGLIISMKKEYEKLFKISNLSKSEINILESFAIVPYLPLNSKYCYELFSDDAKINKNSAILNSLSDKGWLIKKKLLTKCTPLFLKL